jgi:cation diffusion facilitator CzcD-associated flavoprotein CzcO
MTDATPHFDAAVIGAGFSALYMVKSLRDTLGMTVRGYEAGESVGGTWFRNRYPGARCDSDAYVYGCMWHRQLLRDWEWSERYPEQPEILLYLEHVAARHDLKRNFHFNTRVISGEYDEANKVWRVRTDTTQEREREFDRLWDQEGFGLWLASYQDMLFDEQANELCADYIRRKIRQTVTDPAVADRLMPTKHFYGTKRRPLDTNYYETFNRPNVRLVDAAMDGPIEEITETGIRAGGKEYEAEIIVFATGFDAMIGPLKALNLKGRNRRTHAECSSRQRDPGANVVLRHKQDYRAGLYRRGKGTGSDEISNCRSESDWRWAFQFAA